jgi:DNA-binding NarL/FixJ family response regulator
MSQPKFEAFMAAQIAAIETSGLGPDAWIERHSNSFRAAWETAVRHEPSSPVNVLALHPDPVVRAGVVASLRQHGGFEVCEQVPDREGPDEIRFDVVIADHAQAMRLADAARSGPLAAARILVLTFSGSDSDIRQAVRAGIHGYLLLGSTVTELIDAVIALARGLRHLGRSVAQRIADGLTRTPLTSREIAVLQLVVAGECNKAIARQLCIEVGTVKSHMNAILAKLNASSRTHAAAIAVTQGLVEDRMPLPSEAFPRRVSRVDSAARPG